MLLCEVSGENKPYKISKYTNFKQFFAFYKRLLIKNIKEKFIMTIEKKIENGNVTIKVSGRLDTTTAPELDKVLDSSLEGTKELVFDMTNLEYISSAGLRVILKAQKAMNAQGSMKLTGVNDSIMEVFDITGFLDILTIE